MYIHWLHHVEWVFQCPIQYKIWLLKHIFPLIRCQYQYTTSSPTNTRHQLCQMRQLLAIGWPCSWPKNCLAKTKFLYKSNEIQPFIFIFLCQVNPRSLQKKGLLQRVKTAAIAQKTTAKGSFGLLCRGPIVVVLPANIALPQLLYCGSNQENRYKCTF